MAEKKLFQLSKKKTSMDMIIIISLSLSWYSNEICQLLRENLYQYKYKSLTRSWSIHKDEIDYICSLFRNYPEWKIEWN